jgi:hypothetical protein
LLSTSSVLFALCASLIWVFFLSTALAHFV